MTRSSSSRPVVGLFIALAVATSMVGCGKAGPAESPANSDQVGSAPLGSGQGSDGSSTDDSSPDVPADTDDGSTGPTTDPTPPADDDDGGLVLQIDPNILLLAWPSPGDCISHNPANVSLVYNASQAVWQVMDGGHALLAYKRKVDGEAGLELAKSFKKHCFIGRNNSRPNREQYIMDYWKDSVKKPVVATPDCLSHTPSHLSAVDRGALGWRIEGDGEYIQLFDTKADADNGLLVFKHYNRHCYIGRGYDGADRMKYISNWFTSV